MSDTLRIADREFSSRLFVGTGKYRSNQEMKKCHEASGAEVVTVALRRVDLNDKSGESLMDYIDRSKIFLLPNTAACYTAEDAIRTARLGREVGLSNWVKLEVIGGAKIGSPLPIGKPVQFCSNPDRQELKQRIPLCGLIPRRNLAVVAHHPRATLSTGLCFRPP